MAAKSPEAMAVFRWRNITKKHWSADVDSEGLEVLIFERVGSSFTVVVLFCLAI